jgi:hypothetical protein
MITYKAMYKFLPDGIHAEVLDFPGVVSFAKTLEEARRLLASALVGSGTLKNDFEIEAVKKKA